MVTLMNPAFNNAPDHAILDDINANSRAEAETACSTSDSVVSSRFTTERVASGRVISGRIESDSGLAYTKEQVASLTQDVISEMNCADLIDAIKSTELPLLTEDKIARLSFQDRDTLERLLYLARKCVRNQGY